MIPNQKLGASASIQMEVNGASFDYNSISRVEIVLEENSHDMLIVSVSGIAARAVLDYIDVPVMFKLASSVSNSYEFYGYIVDVRPVSVTSAGLVNNSPFQKAELYCMGASYNMRGATSRNWDRYSLSGIATELAEKYGFSVDVPSLPVYHRNLTQSDESDWQFLTRYASSLGFSVAAHGTHLHVYDPYAAVSRRISYAPLLTLRKMQGRPASIPGQIVEFDASFSTRHPDGLYKDTVVSVLDAEGKAYDVSTTDVQNGNIEGEALYVNRRSMVLDSFAEAERAIEAVNKEDYDHYATVLVTGLPGCRPGGTVFVDNYNDPRMDGLWYVQSVKHTAHSSAYMTELSIARNTNSQLVPTGAPAFQPPSDSVLKGREWVSNTGRVDVY